MNNRVVGVGCFGKADTFDRFLEKMLALHVWGDPVRSRRLAGDDDSAGILGSLLENAECEGPGDCCLVRTDLQSGEKTRVTGFLLTLKEDQMRLWIYTRTGTEKSRRYHLDMERLTRLRPRRLH